MTDDNMIVTQTKTWLSSVIIALGLCPFAKREYDQGRVHYAVIRDTDVSRQLEHIILHCAELDKDAGRETTLLIFPEALAEFGVHLDVVDMANALLKRQGYEGVYQLASFHPQYCFADASDEDASNYTNRSPYPMVHILREASITAALENVQNPEEIPARNIRLTQSMGLKAMHALLADCYK
jgi:hypothetical protein